MTRVYGSTEHASLLRSREKSKPALRPQRSRRCFMVSGVTLLSIAVIAVGLLVYFNIQGHANPVSIVGYYDNAAVASDSSVCSKVGSKIMMRQNGSAVDAAIATLLCDGVVNAMSSGIGGGAFALVYNRNNKDMQSFDFRETAPIVANSTMFTSRKSTSSEIGPLAIAVPAEIAGFQTMHALYGRVSWADLFQPTINLCEKGFTVGKALAEKIATQTHVSHLQYGLRQIITNQNTGEFYKEGETMYRPRLAATLRRIAIDGASGFYNGTLAADILADLKEAGSIITEDDLQMYSVKHRRAMSLPLSGYMVYSVPPPAGGAVLLSLLNTIQNYDFNATSINSTNSTVLTYHRIIEAMKFAYAMRTRLGDPDFVDMTELTRAAVDLSRGVGIYQQITDDKTHYIKFYGAEYLAVNDRGTTHLSVVDAEGNAVAITSTINLEFGSTVVGRRTGIIFNNEMDDFSIPNKNNAFGFPPSPANFIQPKKRPLSSMTPVIVLDKNGDVSEVTGASGGSKIISGTTMYVIQSLLFKLSTVKSMDTPRFHHQLIPNTLYVEPNFSKDICKGLEEKGHNITTLKPSSLVVQSIVRRNKQWQAVSDRRKYGAPWGY